jgi:DNA end-binding protein Ku
MQKPELFRAKSISPANRLACAFRADYHRVNYQRGCMARRSERKPVFRLLNIPVALMSGTPRGSASPHARRARQETDPLRASIRIPARVPWKDIVKARKYHKGSYVVLKPEDIKSAAPQSRVDRRRGVRRQGSDRAAAHEKPYFLVRQEAEKGYVLLREPWKTGASASRVVIRTREYLSAVIPRRIAADAVASSAGSRGWRFQTAGRKLESYRVTRAEMQMAEKLIDSMST